MGCVLPGKCGKNETWSRDEDRIDFSPPKELLSLDDTCTDVYAIIRVFAHWCCKFRGEKTRTNYFFL